MEAILNELATKFKETDLSELNKYKELISSKTLDDKILKPYVPLIGKDYIKHRILIYGTAQNLHHNDCLVKDYARSDQHAVYRLYPAGFQGDLVKSKPSYRDVPIQPWQDGVLIALVGMFLNAICGVTLTEFQAIQDHVAISNYYKFSLNDGKRGKHDVNPKNLTPDPEDYWKLNDNLVHMEIEMLKPKYVLWFRGRQDRFLKILANQLLFNPHRIYDTAWILYGGSSFLTQSGKWGQYVDKYVPEGVSNPRLFDKAKKLADHYVSNIKGKYRNRREEIWYFLMHYYLNWKD